MSDNQTYNHILRDFEPVSLPEISSLKLMRRFDSKFLLPIQYLDDFLLQLKAHYKILEIINQRSFKYKTTYYDSPDLKCYMDHQNRRTPRFKIRERFYMVNNLSFLEIKMKQNTGRTLKKRIPLKNNEVSFSEKAKFIKSYVKIDPSELNESASNSFKRISLISFETKERITVDYDLMYANKKDVLYADYYAIIEVKRERKNQQTPINSIFKSYRIQARGFSKYCMSLALLNPKLKQNTFKSNVLHLKRLKYAKYNS